MEGFRVLVLLALKHLFGMHFCPHCPDCSQSDSPCMDVFGSNATAAGGIFGRIDAMYGSIECQKSGSLHLHSQLFVQCYHQYTPLSELMRLNTALKCCGATPPTQHMLGALSTTNPWTGRRKRMRLKLSGLNTRTAT